MKMLIPVVLALLGLVGGAAAGWFLKPAPPAEPQPCLDAEGQPLLGADGAPMSPEECPKRAEDEAHLGEPEAPDPEDPADKSEFYKIERPFVVPVMDSQRVAALVVVSLSIEVAPGKLEDIDSREPRMRDALLRALFDHAYAGGFNGDFTAEYIMKDMRRALLTAARKTAGPDVRDVLVVDILRQEQ